MKRIMPTMRSLLLGAAAAALFVTSTYGQQSILGPPSEANHFIETPKGWVHPKTPWGEPDIQAMLDAKRGLLLALSHELRSPLTRARLNAELLPTTP